MGTFYALITLIVLQSTGEFQTATVMEYLSADICQAERARREAVAAKAAGAIRLYAACVPMPAGTQAPGSQPPSKTTPPKEA